MRKTGVWMLFMALLICLTACDTGEKTEVPETTAAPTVTEAAVDATQAPTETNQPEKEITFQEMTAYEDERCKIQITGLEIDREMEELYIHVNFENKLEEQSLVLKLGGYSVCVNGLNFDLYNGPVNWGIFADEDVNDHDGAFLVHAKESANGTIVLKKADYQKIYDRVGEITDIGFAFYYCNEDGQNVVYTPVIPLYPYGEENAVKATREDRLNDKVIVDNEYARVIVTEYEKDTSYYNIDLFVENKTDKMLRITVKGNQSIINGVSVRDEYVYGVEPGKCGYSCMGWMKNELNEAGIEDVESIAFALCLNIGDPETYYYLAADEKTVDVTLTP